MVNPSQALLVKLAGRTAIAGMVDGGEGGGGRGLGDAAGIYAHYLTTTGALQ